MSDFEARPFELTAKDTEGKVKEVTERLEAGVRELFESERYQAYLKAMSKFHDYSLNNTLLIVMQKPDASLVAGFNKWRDEFERHVKRGEKGIKILAPAPYKIKKELEKLDPDGKPIIGEDGKPVTVGDMQINCTSLMYGELPVSAVLDGDTNEPTEG